MLETDRLFPNYNCSRHWLIAEMPGFLLHRALGTCRLNHQPHFNFIAAAFCLMRSLETLMFSPFLNSSSVFPLLSWGWHTCLQLQILTQIISTWFSRYPSFRTWSFCSQCGVGSFQSQCPRYLSLKTFYSVWCTWVIYLVPLLTTIACWQLSCQCLNYLLKM